MKVQADLRRYVSIIVHWAWLLTLAGLLGGATVYLLSSSQTPVYQASTTILIEEAPGLAGQPDYNSIMTSERRARTYVELMTADPLLQAVIDRLALPTTLGTLRDGITVASVPDTQLIRVQVRDTDPQRVATIANVLVSTFTEQRQHIQSGRYEASKESLQKQLEVLDAQVQQLEARLAALDTGEEDQAGREQLELRLAQTRETYGNLLQSFEAIRVSEAQSSASIILEAPAKAPGLQVAPRIVRNTLFGVIISLLGAIILVFAREAFDDTVKDPVALAKQLGVPVLGSISHARRTATNVPIVISEPRSPAAEAYRSVRTNIDFTSVDHRLRTMLVTSPSPSDGKSTTSVNVGAVMAGGGRQVVLVDADLRRPTLHQWLEQQNRVGLSDLFVQPNVQLHNALASTPVDGVRIITAGPPPPNPAELLGSHRMIEILNEVQKEADIVVVDSPPVTIVTDAAVLAQRVDGVLLVVRAGSTHLRACTLAVEQLRRVNARILGMVINDIPLGRTDYGYVYHGYRTYYGDSDGKRSIGRYGRLRWLIQSPRKRKA